MENQALPSWLHSALLKPNFMEFPAQIIRLRFLYLYIEIHAN